MTKALVVGPFAPDALVLLRAVLDVVRVPEITFERVRPHLSEIDILVTRRLMVGAEVFDAAAELTLGLIVGLVRKIPQHHVRLHQTRRWDREQGMEITSPLLDHPKVLLTPSLGAWTADTDRRVCRAAAAIVEKWMTRTAGGSGAKQ